VTSEKVAEPAVRHTAADGKAGGGRNTYQTLRRILDAGDIPECAPGGHDDVRMD
jgi:hypothetical protein